MPLLAFYYPELRVFYTMFYVLLLLLVGLCLSLSCLFVELEERDYTHVPVPFWYLGNVFVYLS